MAVSSSQIPLRFIATARYLLIVVGLAVSYHLAARLGLEMAYVQVNTSPVWPPTGIALAALLILGYKYWPGISLGVLLGSFLDDAGLDVAMGIMVGNTLEALAGAYVLRRFVQFRGRMDRVQDVVGLAIVAIFATMISATIGASTLMLTGAVDWPEIGALWSTWWIGDLLGALVIAPILLVWALGGGRMISRRTEGGLLLLLLIEVSWYVFAGVPPDGVLHQALIYLIFPFVIWAGLRLGQAGATLAIFLVSGIAIWGTVQGLGPFALESRNNSLVLLQTFLAVVSLTGLILAAASAERRNATDALRQHAEELGVLNDSSRIFLDSFDISAMYRTICELAVTRFGLDAAWFEAADGSEGPPEPVAIFGSSAEALASERLRWDRPPVVPSQTDHGSRTSDGLVATLASPSAYEAFAAFPLVFGGRPIGTLKVLSQRRDFFSEDRQVLIQSYANLAAVAMQNTWLFDEVRTSNRQLHALSQRLMKAQEDERLHLSRELHDESGQLLTALTVQLGLLDREAAEPATVHERVIELKATANAIQENLHRLAVNLRPASLDHLGLVTTLRQFIQEFSRQYKIDVEFEAVGMQDRRLPIEIETALFRVVQESLTNVVLHARATRVDVLLSIANGHVSATVEDNGVGFLPSSAIVEDQLGLFGMRERLKMLGGTFAVESSPGKGTTARAEVPYRA
jgi:signal transduction histidine kinase